MSNLVSEWRLDDASGTVAKDFWGTNDGTWYGAGGGSYTSPSWRTSSECISGGCLAFDGTDDYVSISGSDSSSSNLAITGAITISGWVKFNTAGTSGSITGRGCALDTPGNKGYSLSRSSNNRIYFDTYSTTARDALSSVITITDSNWHFIIGTWDGTTITNSKKLYIDGSLNNQGTSTISAMGQPSYTFRIGRDGQNNFPIDGLIDDVRIYNTAIPTSQIQQNYFSGMNKLLAKSLINSQEHSQRIIGLINSQANK